jgi:3',5'-cyclic AMP phosphodiesterase CpdA
MFTIAHFSDVHLSPLPQPRLSELLNKRLFGYLNWQRRRMRHQRGIVDALINDMRQRKVDHVAITGDITNISLPAEFRQAARWLTTVGAPNDVSVVPGNHDAYITPFRDPGFWRWEAYMSPNDAAKRFLGGAGVPQTFPFLRLFGEVALIGVSTAVTTFPGMATGRVGTTQLRTLEQLLARLGGVGYARVVLIHHPPLPGMATVGRALNDAENLREVLLARGAELVIYGHNHRFDINKLGVGSAAIPIVGVTSASLASETLEKRARYNLYTIAKAGRDRWQVTLRSRIFDGTGGFTEVDHGVL